jgi:protein required for attachment to host cells
MSKIAIPHNALVFVGDGHKALFLRNVGDAEFPNLTTQQVLVDVNPPSRKQGTDRAGRTFKRAGTNRRSAMEITDWHELEKHRFARQVAAILEKLVREQDVKAIIVAAPPRTLADLRNALHSDVKNRILAEINKDLTKHPVAQIEKHLTG